MMKTAESNIEQELYRFIEGGRERKIKTAGRIVVHTNRVLALSRIAGVQVAVDELADGIKAHLVVEPGYHVRDPVEICFGVLPEEGLQRIYLDIDIREHARLTAYAYCVFPHARNVRHIMDAHIRVREEAQYHYIEQHVHGPTGGIEVVPSAQVELAKGSSFKTDFILTAGRVGHLDINYETVGAEHSSMEMTARVNGTGDDSIEIRETGYLSGAYARGALISRIAVRNTAQAHVYNKLVASAAYARGHVDCKEIIQDHAQAEAVPVVEVNHAKAHVTHEAAIGSVDNKQLMTLLSRGLTEEEAVDLIIQGLLQ